MSEQQDAIDTLEAAIAYIDWVRSFDGHEPVKVDAALVLLQPISNYLTDHLADVLHTTEVPNHYALEMARALNKEQKR